MPPNISALSQYQIQRFFQENTSVTPELCNAEAEKIAGQSVTATLSQGGSSYTVEGGQVVVQFRLPSSDLDMDLLKSIEQAYRGFAPQHEYRGRLGQARVYSMNNMGGICMYLARTELQSDNYHLLRVTLDDYARLVDFNNTLSSYNRTQLEGKYLSQLQQLRQGLPARFYPKLDEVIPKLPDLFATVPTEWPLVPNHIDLLENNIHVDPATGRITGICDWRGAEVSPFGMSLGAVEIMLGTLTTSGDFWRYHPNHMELRDYFRNRFCHYLGGTSDEEKRRIETARVVGLFLANGFQNGKPVTEEGEDLGFLGAVLQTALYP
ncbi:kinase-like domain [Cordyceps militaris]|uniref:Kinase-like domain n=1 Tax=Cordyceps militaris TaxID=73501 RepID=A0A2H4SHB4_CORMI|nr:kinase-like domain [Cordyceps militaris]